MFLEFIKAAVSSLFMILHINQTNEFPKALSREDEQHYIELFEKNKDINARNKLIELVDFINTTLGIYLESGLLLAYWYFEKSYNTSYAFSLSMRIRLRIAPSVFKIK